MYGNTHTHTHTHLQTHTHTHGGLTSSSPVPGRPSALCVLPALPVSPHTSSHGKRLPIGFHASHQPSRGPITDEDCELWGRTGRKVQSCQPDPSFVPGGETEMARWAVPAGSWLDAWSCVFFLCESARETRPLKIQSSGARTDVTGVWQPRKRTGAITEKNVLKVSFQLEFRTRLVKLWIPSRARSAHLPR